MTPSDRDNERRELLAAIEARDSDDFFQSAEGFIEPLPRDLTELLVSQLDAELLKGAASDRSERLVSDQGSSHQTAEGITLKTFGDDDTWTPRGAIAGLSSRGQRDTDS